MNDMHNFGDAKKRAINELYEMNQKAAKNADYKAQQTDKSRILNTKNTLGKFNLSLSEDELIVIGLLLILSKDCSDNMLFLALLYILL